MQHAHFVAPAMISLVLLAPLVACDKPPTSPTLPSGQPSPPPATFVTRLELAGPEAIPPGESAQFVATAHMSDGTSRTVTSEAAWTSSAPSVITVNASGRITATTVRGESLIRVTYQIASTSRTTYSIPTGTFRLAGSVRESGFNVDGARVEILSGAGSGQGATTDLLGQFRIYGVAGDTQVRVHKAGYETLMRSMDINGHISLVTFDLKRSRPYPGVAGNYRVTLGAACTSGTLPNDMKRRTYSAVVSQPDGPRVSVRLEGADFALDPNGSGGNSFSGRIEGDKFIATLWSPVSYYYFSTYPSIVERISGSTFLSVYGMLFVDIDGSDLASGSLSGTFAITEGAVVSTRETATCSGGAHQFSFARMG
jgi:hypothetical protein